MAARHAALLPLLALLATAAFATRDLAGELNPGGGDPARAGFFGPGFFGPGFGRFGSPGFGGGWGGGYGGPGGGYAHGGVVPPTVVCSEKGPCYKKTLTCPKSCFWSYSRSGNGYGGGGGGGGCTIDCKTKCTAYC